MKRFLTKLLKVTFLLVLIFIVIFLVFGVVLIIDWPWWVGLFILLGLVGLITGILFIRKIMQRRKEQHFVHQVIEQDESFLKTHTGKQKEGLKDLQDKWKEAVDSLRRSHLRKFGNPLYVLPWYMVLGESGSGKTTAISSARLSSPFAEVTRTTGISGTRNCDWWFFEQAVILDTAGRYAIPVDEGRDKEEWQKFLSLLMQYRKKEPINCLIVTVAADKLLEATPETLEEDGRNIRSRLDELMRVLGVRFPVYVLVTKCDLVQGMTQFCDNLPEESLDQPMGVVNQDLSTDAVAFQERAVTIIGERLRSLRLLLVHQPKYRDVDPALLLFPEEFENLKRGLEPFMKGAFQENPYQETPLLRGLYFSSGRQEGTPFSHFLSALGLIGEREVLPGTSKGLFLHDLFSKLLPRDRGLFFPTRRAVRGRTLTRNLGVTSWVVIGLALCGFLSYSFVKNLTTLREVSHALAKPPLLQGEFLADLVTMDRFNKGVKSVVDKNRNWWLPRFGLIESVEIEKGLKEKYCNQFRHGFLARFDKEMEGTMIHLDRTTSAEVIGQYVIHLARRINLLKAQQVGAGLDVLKAKPQPSYVSYLSGESEEIGLEIKETFGSLYLYYLIWRLDTSEINQEIEFLQSWLKRILSLKEESLRWLVAWVDQQGRLPAVTLGDFWGGSRAVPGEKTIAPAYTNKGKEMIDSLVGEIEDALPDPLFLAKGKAEFWSWYRTVCFKTWQDFGSDFMKGFEKIKEEKERKAVAEKMSADGGPYFSFLDTAAADLEPLAQEEEDLPEWLHQVYQIQMLRQLGKGGEKAGALGKMAKKGKRMISKIERKIGGQDIDISGSQSLAAQGYQEYRKALSGLNLLAGSTKQAYQLVLSVFSEDLATSESPFFAASSAVSKVKNAVMIDAAKEKVFWDLFTGPLTYLWMYARMEASCHLQNQWEETVLSEAKDVRGRETMVTLLGQDGPVWKFVNDTAKPFIGWSLEEGYYSREAEAMRGTVPFEQAFISFLNEGAQFPKLLKKSYRVTVKGLPTDANPDARMKPHATRLEILCAEGTQSLVNLHYPVTKTFTWSPDSCASVLFQIEISDTVLAKKYTGSQAFPDFLQDFWGGHRTFYAHEFPDKQEALGGLGIKYIRVNYQFSGDQEVIKQIFSLPEEAPRSIVWCWDR
jgi:type VI secretion system protein ImpL